MEAAELDQTSETQVDQNDGPTDAGEEETSAVTADEPSTKVGGEADGTLSDFQLELKEAVEEFNINDLKPTVEDKIEVVDNSSEIKIEEESNENISETENAINSSPGFADSSVEIVNEQNTVEIETSGTDDTQAEDVDIWQTETVTRTKTVTTTVTTTTQEEDVDQIITPDETMPSYVVEPDEELDFWATA